MITEPAPVIGITGYTEQAQWGIWDVPAVLLPRSYLDAVAAAGGIPVLLPPLPGVEPVLERLDGLVVAGGPDVDAARYGEPAHATAAAPRTERDGAELALIERALADRLPFLGICRGHQLLNVVRGGSLIQHLPDHVGHHGHGPTPGAFARHPVLLEPDTRLAAILGRLQLDVPTHHHQAIGRLGHGLLVSARAADGTVEGVEDPTLPFCLGVQWHPEEGDDPALLAALVTGARLRQVTVLRPPAPVSDLIGPDAARPRDADSNRHLLRQLDRLADRLRVLGPRLAARGGPEADGTLTAVRLRLQRLADLAADAEHRPRRPVPQLAAHALADQVLVLGHDLLDTAPADWPGPAGMADLLDDLRGVL